MSCGCTPVIFAFGSQASIAKCSALAERYALTFSEPLKVTQDRTIIDGLCTLDTGWKSGTFDSSLPRIPITVLVRKCPQGVMGCSYQGWSIVQYKPCVIPGLKPTPEHNVHGSCSSRPIPSGVFMPTE
jgi:hypothetical protein